MSGIEFIYCFTLKLIFGNPRISKGITDNISVPTSVQKVKPLVYDTLDPRFLKYYRESLKIDLNQKRTATIEYLN